MGQECGSLECEGKYGASAAITHIFSYVIKAKVRYRYYISTGEAMTFVHAERDPDIVECYLCIPIMMLGSIRPLLHIEQHL